MENSISQIQADVSSMRGKYKAAVANRSDSVSPVFSPGESPPGGEGYAVATPKQMHSAAAYFFCVLQHCIDTINIIIATKTLYIYVSLQRQVSGPSRQQKEDAQDSLCI